MKLIGQPERATENRVINLFRDELEPEPARLDLPLPRPLS